MKVLKFVGTAGFGVLGLICLHQACVDVHLGLLGPGLMLGAVGVVVLLGAGGIAKA